MRKSFWIDVPLQVRILFFVLILISATLALAYLSVIQGLEQASFQADHAYASTSWIREALLVPFLVASTIALVGGALLAFFWAHRVIGPMMVLTAGLKRIGKGDLRDALVLRETGLRWGTIEEFSRLRESLRERIHQDRKLLAEVENRLDALSSRVRSKPAAKELRSIQEELEKVTSSFQL